MKKKNFILFIVIAVLLLGVNFFRNKNDRILNNIQVNKITKIIISTQMSDPKSDIVLKKDDYQEVIDKIKSFSLTKINEENKNGWQYLFKIYQGENKQTTLMFMDNRVTINGVIYKVDGYDKNMFLYLFE